VMSEYGIKWVSRIMLFWGNSFSILGDIRSMLCVFFFFVRGASRK
jgi:hypothetical protein